MKTKEAIEKVRSLNEILYEETVSDIIFVIKRGEKYEAMFKTFVQFIFNWRYPISHKVMRDKVRELRQKYFPKDCNK